MCYWEVVELKEFIRYHTQGKKLTRSKYCEFVRALFTVSLTNVAVGDFQCWSKSFPESQCLFLEDNCIQAIEKTYSFMQGKQIRGRDPAEGKKSKWW